MPAGVRHDKALKSALSTSSVRMWVAIDQPTIILVAMSMIAARYTQPAAVQRYVISAHHTESLVSAANSRFSAFGATGRACLESVVTL